MRKPSTRSDAQLVEQYIGTAYDVVKEVHDNLDSIETVADNLVHSLKYLGASPTAPDTRLDGSPIQDGDYYLDSNTSALIYYNEMTGFWAEVDPAVVLQAAEEAKASEEAAALSAAEVKDNSTATAADREQTGLDAEATAADRIVTQADRAQTTADANQTSTDALNTALDSAATSDDRVAVNADRAQTNADRAASEAARIGAETAEQNAAQAFDSFDDKYLGSKTEAPTVDNDGDPLQVGATYWHDNQDDTGSLQYWNGNEWEAPDKAASASAQAAQASAQAALTSEGNALAAASSASADALSTANDAVASAESRAAAELAEINAGDSEDAAKISQDAAKVSEDAALISRNSASVSAEESAQSAIESEASAVRAEEAADVVTWKQYASKQVDMEREREANNNLFAASSFVHYGKHNVTNSSTWERNAINEGLFTQEGFPNLLSMGATTSSTGTSETNFPVTAIAGFVSEIINVNQSYEVESVIKFPEAPDGTIIYDSTGNARGTGKANLNLLTEVDPKYGDVAADINDAVGRAFEGWSKYGDFRGSASSVWIMEGGTATFSNGNATFTRTASTGNAQSIPTIHNSPTLQNVECTVEFYVESMIGQALILGQHTGVSIYENVSLGHNSFTFISDDDQLELGFRVGNTVGDNVVVSNFSFKPVTEEVVTERVDMYGGESFLEEVSLANPYVYPKGMIQSQATAMNGIPTVRSNRPDTYYAVFTGDTGDTGSTGLGVNFFAATDAEKQVMLSDKSNNLYLMNDGSLTQWRMRQRTIAGAGNGDWYNTDSNADGSVVTSPYLRFDSATGTVNPQGSSDIVGHYIYPLYSGGVNTGRSIDALVHKGVFHAVQDSVDGRFTGAYNGECYFHVWGTVPRLNQGAKHPSFNSMGTARTVNIANTSSYLWHQTNPDLELNSAASCFIPQITGVQAGHLLANIANGSTYGSRDDGKLYDAIYPSGQGGVIDDRLSAYEVTIEDVSQAKAKLKNGSLRGMHKLPFTVVGTITMVGSIWDVGFTKFFGANQQWDIPLHGSDSATQGTGIPFCYVLDASGNAFELDSYSTTNASGNGVCYISGKYGDVSSDFPAGTYRVVIARDMETSVEGNADNGFTVQDVIGDPANIIQTQALVNGWLGHWIPMIPDGSGTQIRPPIVRKLLESTTNEGGHNFKYTYNFGDSWAVTSSTVDKVANTLTMTSTNRPNVVVVFSYYAAPYPTEQDINRPVLFGEKGVGSVTYTCNSGTAYSIFAESVLGKVLTNSNKATAVGSSTMQSVWLDGLEHKMQPYKPLAHAPVIMGAPENNSPAVKALIYPTSENQQVSLNVAYNELVWSSAPFINVDGVSDSLLAGSKYRVNTGAGLVTVTPVQSITFLNQYARGVDGNYYSATGALRAVAITDGSGSWGDDSTVRIIDGQGTFNNLNGDTCLYGSNRTTKKLGYTKNRARVGKQTPGVDL